MADIQLIQCKNQQKTSSYCRNSMPYIEIGIKESNDVIIRFLDPAIYELPVKVLTSSLWWCQNFNRKFINSRSCACAVKIWLKIALNAVRLPKFEPFNGISWSPRKIMVKDLRQRFGLAWFCACAESCMVFNTGPYTVLPDNSILVTANMQSETGFPSSHQLKSYVTSKSRLKLASCAVLSADAGLLVIIEFNLQQTYIPVLSELWLRPSVNWDNLRLLHRNSCILGRRFTLMHDVAAANNLLWFLPRHASFGLWLNRRRL